ncbi:sugar phosphate isomerase/epimerase family protein [Tenggerimyces flavus]|uniref:Sugar phosphate isomerase/epimerase family protein n=1 Tax=Tenggerimyces flavus TaxID=1708749 RepID=A0ABV7YJZ1_9ACTN|nr:sugar phosphate isomerase/epimerase [Tenggerimyces flavus]MBM7789612.1 myo-inositol catabolism protein IolH [Tenggerimyces flavus]
MKIALDPYMLRGLPLPGVIHEAADLGYQYLELSPREDFLPFFVHPRADAARIAEVKSALRESGVEIASVLPLYRWSGPDEDARSAAVRYWKRAIEICVELGCEVMNSEFNGRPDQSAASEGQFWRSLEELLPIFEREGVALNLEAHPDDFCERNTAAVDLVRAIDRPWVNYLYCAPHTFHLDDGEGDVGAMLDYAAPRLAHVHLADSFNHRGSSGLRYIVNPPGSTARIHQHLDIGEGEVDWDAFFGGLRRLRFDGIATVCVFAWEERARESATTMLARVTKELVARTGAHEPTAVRSSGGAPPHDDRLTDGSTIGSPTGSLGA